MIFNNVMIQNTNDSFLHMLSLEKTQDLSVLVNIIEEDGYGN